MVSKLMVSNTVVADGGRRCGLRCLNTNSDWFKILLSMITVPSSLKVHGP